jgi:hypothetical protein
MSLIVPPRNRLPSETCRKHAPESQANAYAALTDYCRMILRRFREQPNATLHLQCDTTCTEGRRLAVL